MPQPAKFRNALSFHGKEEANKLGFFKRILLNNRQVFSILEMVFFWGFFAYCLYINNFRLFSVVLLYGAYLFARPHLLFIKWYAIVYVFKRNFYSDRRKLYKQGSLLHHLEFKRPKKFKTGHVIWAQTEKLKTQKFNRLSSKSTPKEIIL